MLINSLSRNAQNFNSVKNNYKNNNINFREKQNYATPSTLNYRAYVSFCANGETLRDFIPNDYKLAQLIDMCYKFNNREMQTPEMLAYFEAIKRFEPNPNDYQAQVDDIQAHFRETIEIIKRGYSAKWQLIELDDGSTVEFSEEKYPNGNPQNFVRTAENGTIIQRGNTWFMCGLEHLFSDEIPNKNSYDLIFAIDVYNENGDLYKIHQNRALFYKKDDIKKDYCVGIKPRFEQEKDLTPQLLQASTENGIYRYSDENNLSSHEIERSPYKLSTYFKANGKDVDYFYRTDLNPRKSDRSAEDSQPSGLDLSEEEGDLAKRCRRRDSYVYGENQT